MLKWLGVVVFLYVLGFVAFVAKLPHAPARAPKADGIVALTGGDARLDAAVGLLESGAGQRLLITGVHPETTKEDLKHLSHGGRRFDCCAGLGYAAEDTHGNAEETAIWTKARHYKSLIVVTARYHMPRSLTEFQAAMPGVRLEPYPVEPGSIDLGGWWHDARALGVLQFEFAKYLASRVMTAFEKPDPTLDRGVAAGNARMAS